MVRRSHAGLKVGDSLAVRLPAAVVDALNLKEGDQIEIRIVDKRAFEVGRDEKQAACFAHSRTNQVNSQKRGER